jgi:hypothetical protein
VITVSNGTTSNVFYVQPNINGALVFDLNPVVAQAMDLSVNSTDAVPSLFASTTVQDAATSRNILGISTIIQEGYEVLGLFTVQATEYPLDGSALINAAFHYCTRSPR